MFVHNKKNRNHLFMKKSCLPILTIFLIILFITGCTKEPINNEIEGFWILREFTTLEDGKITRCNRLYYSITRMVTEISEKQGNNNYGSYIGKTKYGEEEKQLILTDFKIRQSTSDSGMDAPVEKLRKFGINNQEITIFNIIFCNGKKMTLQSNYATLELERF